MKELPEGFGNLQNLGSLDLSYLHLKRLPNSIKNIQYLSDVKFAYSLNSEISIMIDFSQPINLSGGDLIISLETGEIIQDIHIPPFSLSYTRTAIYTVQEGDFSEHLSIVSVRLSDGANLTNKDGEDVDFSSVAEINFPTMNNIIVDGTSPSVNFTIPDPNALCFGQTNEIMGTVTDRSGNILVELTIYDEKNAEIFHESKRYYTSEWLFSITEESIWFDYHIYVLLVNGMWSFTPPASIWKNQEYLFIAKATDFAGNTATSQISSLYGIKTSTIKATISNSSITFGELVTISGQITPVHNLANAEVYIEYISPDDNTISVNTTANKDGLFSYHITCDEITSTGLWKIRTFWKGNGCLLPATSETQHLTVNRASTSVTLDLTSDAVKVGETISIGGMFTPIPYCTGKDLSGKKISLLIGNEIQIVQTNDSYGRFQLKDYDKLTIPGKLTVRAMYHQDKDYLSNVSNPMKLNVLESSGYAIIVQGQIASGEGTASYSKTTMFVREQLESRGILDNENFNDIMYFNADISHPKVDARPSKKEIQDAIVQWASDRMNKQPGNLYIVMVNHGLEEQFFIDPEVITSQDLKRWLAELQSLLKPQAMEQYIVLILGFCHSGSFIDDISGKQRIIIASAAADEFSYKGPLDADKIREGEFFVSEFFKKIALGQSIKQSFNEAVVLTEKFTQTSQMGRINAPPFFDQSEQHPMLDDNGDGVGTNNILESLTDGKISNNFVIGVSSLTHNDPGDVVLTSVAPTIFLDDPNQFPDHCFWATVNNNKRQRIIWIEIKAPEYGIEGSETGQKELVLPKILGTFNDETNRNEWQWDEIISKEDFSLPGLYQVFYFAKDNLSENVSPFMETKVYRNKPENQWPSVFHLQSPANEIILTTQGFMTLCENKSDPNCYTHFSWTESYDTDNDHITYSLIFSVDDETFSGNLTIFDTDHHTRFLVDLPIIWDSKTVY